LDNTEALVQTVKSNNLRPSGQTWVELRVVLKKAHCESPGRLPKDPQRADFQKKYPFPSRAADRVTVSIDDENRDAAADKRT
jgi:hypothetical protein